MIKFKSFLFYSIISISLFNCTTVKITDPTPIEREKSGVVIFKIFPYWLKDEIIFYLRTINLNPNQEQIFAEVEAIDESGKKLTLKQLPENFKVEEENQGEKSTNYYFHHLAYGAILLPDANKKYVITNIKYCERYFWFWKHIFNSNCFNYPLNPFNSFSVMPIKGKPGKVEYLGFYRLEEVESKTIDEYSGTNSGRIFFIPYEKKVKINANLIKDNETFKNENNFYNYLFPEVKENTPKNEEIATLKQFIQNQKTGYWKQKAEARLKELE